MATFVLVHGGGHGGWCWKPLAKLLRSEGHEVHAPTLTGLGERRHLLNPDIDLGTHIEDIASLLFHEDLEGVILVGHSYGGMVITGAADRAIERVRRLVYLDAAIPVDGEALTDSSPGLQKFNDMRMMEGIALGLWPETCGPELYGLADPRLAGWAMPRLAPHPWKCFETALRMNKPDAVAALPRAIINCRKSLDVRPAETLARWFDGDYVREIDTGHDLMLTEPEAVARMLIEISELDA